MIKVLEGQSFTTDPFECCFMDGSSILELIAVLWVWGEIFLVYETEKRSITVFKNILHHRVE